MSVAPAFLCRRRLQTTRVPWNILQVNVSALSFVNFCSFRFHRFPPLCSSALSLSLGLAGPGWVLVVFVPGWMSMEKYPFISVQRKKKKKTHTHCIAVTSNTVPVLVVDRRYAVNTTMLSRVAVPMDNARGLNRESVHTLWTGVRRFYGSDNAALASIVLAI